MVGIGVTEGGEAVLLPRTEPVKKDDVDVGIRIEWSFTRKPNGMYRRRVQPGVPIADMQAKVEADVLQWLDRSHKLTAEEIASVEFTWTVDPSYHVSKLFYMGDFPEGDEAK